MRKLSNSGFDIDRSRPRFRLRTFLTIALGLLLSPILFECSLTCVARWKGMFGTTPTVRTPILDALSAQFVAATMSVGAAGRTILGKLPLDPFWLIGYAFVMAAVGSSFLRRK